MNPSFRLFQRLAIVIVAGALAIVSLITLMAPRAWGALNAHRQVPVGLYQFSGLAQRSTVYDVNGLQIGAFQRENAQRTVISSVPTEVIAAILAVEDDVFMSHDGVNLRAIARALLSNSQGGSRQGASTITQQVAKNEFLGGSISGGRTKILQARYATMLEKILTKEEILERYVNTVYFGNNAYGLAAAAETYYGKSVSELNLIEGAFIAGLVQAPSTYDPFSTNGYKSYSVRKRYKIVLGRLVDEGLITPDEATAACADWQEPKRKVDDPATCPLPTKAAPVSNEESTVVDTRQDANRSYFSEFVKDYLRTRGVEMGLGATEEEVMARLYRGGLKIYTTLDKNAQLAAERAAAEQMPDNATGITAAVLSLDTQTGAIRAMVGGEGFVPNTNEVNLALRRRQTGSSVKMFVLAAALEAGILPDDVIDGTLPCTLPNPGNAEEPTFLISNGVSEPVGSLRRMTALSINCAYARLAQVVGLDKVVALMYGMASSEFLPKPNFDSDLERANLIKPYASLSTGANELSPLDMASGAQTIANGGVHREPYAIERIEDSNGEVIWKREEPKDPEQVLTRDNALRAVDVMKGVIKFGTARRTPLANDRPAAGKTGTQDDNTNAWFVGFTPQLTTAVWVGDPKGYTPMVRIPEFVKADGYVRIQGAMYPARIWKQYMDAAHENLPVLDWDAPPPGQPTEARPDTSPVRVYLPGNECLASVVAGTIPPTTTTIAGKKTTTTTQPGTTGDTVVVSLVDPIPLPTLSTTTTTTIASPTTLDADHALRQILRDRYPRGPVNTIPPNQYWVYECAAGLPTSAQTIVPGQ